MFPSPALCRLGICSSRDPAQDRRVFTPTSPNRSESGIAPAPQESSTIRKIRFILTFPPSQIHMAPRSGSPPNPGSNQLFLHLHCHFQRHLHHVRKGVLPFCGSSLLPGEDVVGNGANAQGPACHIGRHSYIMRRPPFQWPECPSFSSHSWRPGPQEPLVVAIESVGGQDIAHMIPASQLPGRFHCPCQ